MADERDPKRDVKILPAVVAAGIALAIAAGAVAYAAGHYGERTKTVTVQGAGPGTTGPPATKVSPAVAAGADALAMLLKKALKQLHGEDQDSTRSEAA